VKGMEKDEERIQQGQRRPSTKNEEKKQLHHLFEIVSEWKTGAQPPARKGKSGKMIYRIKKKGTSRGKREKKVAEDLSQEESSKQREMAEGEEQEGTSDKEGA